MSSKGELATVASLTNVLQDWKALVPKAHAFLEQKIIEAQNPNKAWLNSVPSDCLLMIFQYLSKRHLVAVLPFVSRYFGTLVKLPFFWNTFHLQQLLTSSELPLMKRWRLSKDPTYSYSRSEKEQFWIRKVIEGRFRTKYFDLSACQISSRDIVAIVRNVKGVAGFDFSHCLHLHSDVLEDLRDILIQSAPITDPSTLFGSSSQQGTAPKVGEDCKSPLQKRNENQRAIAEQSSALGFGGRNADIFDVTDEFATSVTPAMIPVRHPASISHSLTTLKLNFCEEFSEDSLLSLIAAVGTISHLELSGCEQLTPLCFRSVFTALPNLTHLKCRATRISQASFLGVDSPDGDEPQRVLPLQILNMACCPSVDDEVLCKLGALFPHLKELIINSCQFVTDVGINAVKQSNTELRVLALDNCPQVGEISLLGLSKSLTKLRCLSCDKTRLNGNALASMLEYPNQLEGISADGCLSLARDVVRSAALQQLVKAKMELLTKQTFRWLSITKQRGK